MATNQKDITTLSKEELTQLFEESAEALISIPEPQRNEYVKNVIASIIEALKQVNTLPKLQQLSAALSLIGEIAQNSPVILPAFLYTVKHGNVTVNCPHCKKPVTIQEPDFRTFYNPILSEAIENLIKYIINQAQQAK